VVLGRPARDAAQPLAVDVDDTEGGWTDWYADARARSDEERRRREAEAETAEQEWRDWYAEHHQVAARERSRRWETGDRARSDEVPLWDERVRDERADQPVEAWHGRPADEFPDEADLPTDARVKL